MAFSGVESAAHGAYSHDGLGPGSGRVPAALNFARADRAEGLFGSAPSKPVPARCTLRACSRASALASGDPSNTRLSRLDCSGAACVVGEKVHWASSAASLGCRQLHSAKTA